MKSIRQYFSQGVLALLFLSGLAGLFFLTYENGKITKAMNAVRQENTARWDAIERQAKTPEEKQVAAFLRSEIENKECPGAVFPSERNEVRTVEGYKENLREGTAILEARCAQVLLGQRLFHKQASPTDAFATRILVPIAEQKPLVRG